MRKAIIQGPNHASLNGERATRDPWLTCPVVIALSLAILCFALGAFTLKRGRRGAKLDDHPHCARCTFDLTGLKDSTCPECGTILLSPESRSIGTFRPRRRLIASGCLLIALGSLLIANSIFGFTGRVDWYAKMPLWFLVRQASQMSDFTSQHEVREELLRRGELGLVPPDKLSALALSWLAECGTDPSLRLQSYVVRIAALPTLPAAASDAIRLHILAIHAERTAPLGRYFLWFLENEEFSGRHPAQELEKYLRQCVDPQLHLVGPAICAPGEPLALTFHWNSQGGYAGVMADLDLPGTTKIRNGRRGLGGVEQSFSPLFLLNADRTWHQIIASSEPGRHEIKGMATIALTGQDFTAFAARDSTWQGFVGGVSRIPPLMLRFPIGVSYTVDPSLPGDTAAATRREIMRSISVAFEQSHDDPEIIRVALNNTGAHFLATLELQGVQGKDIFPLANGQLAATESSATISLWGQTPRPVERLLAEIQMPVINRTFRKLRAKFTNVSLSGPPPTSVEPFELEIELPPP